MSVVDVVSQSRGREDGGWDDGLAEVGRDETRGTEEEDVRAATDS